VTWNDESQLSTLIRESRIHSLIDSFGVVCSQIKLLPPILLLGKSHTVKIEAKIRVVTHIMHSHPMMKGTLLNERPIKEVTIVGDIYTRLHFSHVWKPAHKEFLLQNIGPSNLLKPYVKLPSFGSHLWIKKLHLWSLYVNWVVSKLYCSKHNQTNASINTHLEQWLQSSSPPV